MRLPNRINFFLLLAIGIYAILTAISLNYCYFWDNIQQISKEAHWFYFSDFSSLLMPAQNSGSEIVATGYHPPLMGIMTAGLWKIFGYKLWISHVFVFLWAILLIFNAYKIISRFFLEKQIGWVLLIVVLESSLLSQFAIASPDFILFTAFIISLRAVLERKPCLLSIGIFFLCCINMRGVFVGAIMLLINCYFIYLQSEKKLSFSSFIKTLLPYLPTLLLLVAYFVYYFFNRGWFFTNSDANGHYSMPVGFGRIVKHLAEFVIRTAENGRIVIWLLGIYVTFKTVKSKSVLSNHTKVLLLFFLLLNGLYLFFVFVSQMPFSARYFMPQFFLLTILALSEFVKFINERKIKLVFVLILCFELTGHFWIYPEKTAKSWDCTLAHLPYYELRKDCFDYIDAEKLNYKDISGGYCLYGNREFVELKNKGKIIGNDTISKYFIYSNISNVEDSFVDELKNTNYWTSVKTFEKGQIFITIYKRVLWKKEAKQ